MRIFSCADKILTFEHPQIMGVLNITPDSFSDGGLLYASDGIDLQRIRRQAEDMVANGAAILDIGGESTRPGAAPVSVTEELDRVLPVVSALNDLDVIISVDTRHTAVAAAAIDAGAHMINDVSAGADDGMLATIAAADVGYALMHMQGNPQTMQRSPSYQAVVAEVAGHLQQRHQACVEAGIGAERLMLDPGFGFGKTLEHNLALLAHLVEVRVDETPLLVGLSRKSMLGKLTGREVHERLHASVAAALLAAERGADVLRVHDVAATRDAIKVFTAVRDAQ